MKSACSKRQTRETDITVALGSTEPKITTPLPMLSHLLSALDMTSGLNLQIKAIGDTDVDPHHVIEDVGIVLGEALIALTDGYSGIARYADRKVAMDDALVDVTIDLSGRSGAYLSGFPEGSVGTLVGEALAEFFHGLARGGRLTLHVQLLNGHNAHHQVEAVFKALGLCLRDALQPRGDGPLSTKGGIL